MKTVQLHEFIANVADQAYCLGQLHYLCLAADKVYDLGGKYAMAKLLEESFPGRVYGSPDDLDWTDWKGCLATGIYSMHPDNYFQTDRDILRRQLIAKLLAQPDRTLVLPEDF